MVSAVLPEPPVCLAVLPSLRVGVGALSVLSLLAALPILTVKVTTAPVFTLPVPLAMPVPVATIEAIVGAVVSICNVPAGLYLVAPARLAAMPLPPVMVAPLRLNDEMMRSAVFWPAATV